MPLIKSTGRDDDNLNCWLGTLSLLDKVVALQRARMRAGAADGDQLGYILASRTIHISSKYISVNLGNQTGCI